MFYVDRSEAGLKPRFVNVEPPSNADISDVLQKISHRVIRKLRAQVIPTPRQRGVGR